MNASAVYPSTYLKAEDIVRSPFVLTINSVGFEMMHNSNEEKPVLGFKETKKRLVCNRTNWKVLIKLLGSETDAWLGKQVGLVLTQVDFKGESCEAIRVSAKASTPPTAAPQAPPSETELDDIPF